MAARRGGRPSVANSSIEGIVKETEAAAKRIEQYELQQERQKLEEDNLEDLIVRGEINEDEAHQKFARMQMRKGEESKKGVLDNSVAAGADFQTTMQMLEEILDNESKIPLVRWFKNFTGIRQVEKAVARERLRRKKARYSHICPPIFYMVHSNLFEIVIGVIMLANGYTIGETMSLPEGQADTGTYYYLEHAFTGIFSLEICLRLIADGWTWWWDLSNVADASLVFLTGIVPLWILGPFGVQSGAMRGFQVLRVLRLVRLVRMVRTVSWFRIFWTLIRGLVDSGRTLLWTYVLISTVLFMFAVFGVYFIGRGDAFEGDEVALEYFSTVPRALMTLFQITTFDSWAAIARPLISRSSWVSLYFISFIAVVPLSLLNLITAVIVNNAFQSAQSDEEAIAKDKQEDMKREVKALKKIFLAIDTDGNGNLSKEEYMEAVETNEQVQDKFDTLQIAPAEVEEIWHILDTGSGEITVDEFAHGLQALQGTAKAKDSFSICKRNQHLNKRVEKLTDRVAKQQAQAEHLRLEAARAHRLMGGVMLELKDFVEALAPVIPPSKVSRDPAVLQAKHEEVTAKATAARETDARSAMEESLRRRKGAEDMASRKRNSVVSINPSTPPNAASASVDIAVDQAAIAVPGAAEDT